MIDDYKFGKISINNKNYTNDVIIIHDTVIDNWWRQKGHELSIKDIGAVVEKYNPNTIVIGTGKFGLMKVLPETISFLKSHQIEIIIQKTSRACKEYNRLEPAKRVLGAFHLTC